MSPRESFGVVVRTAGLLILLYGLYDLQFATYAALTPARTHNAKPMTYALFGIAFVLVSLYFLRGAPQLMNFCYPDTSATESEQKQNR